MGATMGEFDAIVTDLYRLPTWRQIQTCSLQRRPEPVRNGPPPGHPLHHESRAAAAAAAQAAAAATVPPAPQPKNAGGTLHELFGEWNTAETRLR